MNKLNYNNGLMPFEEIPIGGIFVYQNKVYMRMENVFRTVGKGYTYELDYSIEEISYPVYDLAVSLSDGTIDSFESDTMVLVQRLDKVEIVNEVE